MFGSIRGGEPPAGIPGLLRFRGLVNPHWRLFSPEALTPTCKVKDRLDIKVSLSAPGSSDVGFFQS